MIVLDTHAWLWWAVGSKRLSAAGLGAEGFHRDPADRFIYATARRARSGLVTRDERIRAFDPERVIW